MLKNGNLKPSKKLLTLFLIGHAYKTRLHVQMHKTNVDILL